MRKPVSVPSSDEQAVLDSIAVVLLEADDLPRCHRLLAGHHYLGDFKPVGERLHYAITDAAGEWLGVLVFCAGARRLGPRDRWIGWSEEQRRRRLPLVVCNARFLLLPDRTFPNLASKALKLVLARLSADWEARYGHPVLVVETFVDPAQFRGTLYTAGGWSELGATDGSGRHARDFYVRHERPKRLFVRELCRHARRSLQAGRLRPALAALEARTPPRATQSVPELRSLCAHFQRVPDYRTRIAGRLSQAQRAALGIRRASEDAPLSGAQPAHFSPALRAGRCAESRAGDPRLPNPGARRAAARRTRRGRWQGAATYRRPPCAERGERARPALPGQRDGG